MNKKDIIYITLNLMENITGNSYLNSNITLDSDINDCLIYMYFYMMSGNEKYCEEFVEKYDKLNQEQQEFVKNDYLNIINAQEEINKEKRKGEMNYE